MRFRRSGIDNKTAVLTERAKEGALSPEEILALSSKGGIENLIALSHCPTLPLEILDTMLLLESTGSKNHREANSGRQRLYLNLAGRADLQATHIKSLVQRTWANPSLLAPLLSNTHIEQSALLLGIQALSQESLNDQSVVGYLITESPHLTSEVAYLIYSILLRAIPKLDKSKAGFMNRGLIGLASNEKTPPDLIAKLAKNTKRTVASAAAANPNLPLKEQLDVRVSHLPSEFLSGHLEKLSMKELAELAELPEETTLREALAFLRGEGRSLKTIDLVEEGSIPTTNLLKEDASSPWVEFFDEAKTRFYDAARLTQTLALHLEISATREMVESLEEASAKTRKHLDFYGDLLNSGSSERSIRALGGLRVKLQAGLESYEQVVDALLILNEASDSRDTEDAVDQVLARIKGWSEVREAEGTITLKVEKLKREPQKLLN